MKIKLVAPNVHTKDNVSAAVVFKVHRLSLPLLAALTPAGHTITIIDEAFAPDNPDNDADLIGLTVLSENCLRAYELADLYRLRGTKVVMGGIHPTVLPEEALKHADSVVIGEAEEVWPELISDAAAGKLRRIYKAAKPPKLKRYPLPRRDLYPESTTAKSYTPLATGIETSRGCPYDCEFCSINQATGRPYRHRPVAEIIAEIESIDSTRLFFLDEAFGLNKEKLKEFLSALIPLRRLWIAQGTVSLADDPQVLKLMYRSGCRGLFIGFESIQRDIQKEIKKIKNLNYHEVMHRFYSEGVPVMGSFVFGFDHENKDIFDQTYEFIMKHHLDCVQLRILTPYPGTRLYTRLLKEKRLFVPDWWLHGYTANDLLYKPKSMTAQELLDGYGRLIKQVFSIRGIVRRFFGFKTWKKRTIVGTVFKIAVNKGQRLRYFSSLNKPQPFYNL